MTSFTCLNDFSEAQSEASAISTIVLSGAVLVQMLKPGDAKNIAQYTSQVFIPHFFYL